MTGCALGGERNYHRRHEDLAGSPVGVAKYVAKYTWHSHLAIGHRSLVPTADYDKIGSQYGRSFLWTTLHFYTPFLFLAKRESLKELESKAGPFDYTASLVETKA